MQQQLTAQNSIDTHTASCGSRLQQKPKLATAQRVDFKTIKRAARFERVLAYYGIALSGGPGAQRKALCPFHRDTRPSLNVNLDMKVFNCFPCGGGGDIVKFVAKKEYPSNPEGHLIEAAEKLVEICGISPSEFADKAGAATKEAAVGSVTVTSSAAMGFHNGEFAGPNRPLTFELKVDPRHRYLTERGLSADIVETFGLGCCMSEHSIMRQRIVIPIHNERGELVAYAGRWPGDRGWPEGTHKYMFPAKFRKMGVLFNLNRVLEGMFKGQWFGHERHVVVVEGFFGVFAVHPLAPCVALMGSVISADHVRLLHEANVSFITLLLDGASKPETYEEAAVRNQKYAGAAFQLSADGFFVSAPILGVGEQPDTIERERLEQLIAPA